MACVGNWWTKLENELKQYKVIGSDKKVTGSNLLCPAQNNSGADALTIWNLLKLYNPYAFKFPKELALESFYSFFYS